MAGVRVTGLNETVRALQRLGVEVDDIKDVMADIAAEGARLAGQYAPRRSGRLAASVRGNRAKGKAVVTAGKAKVPWAGPVNYGWPARGIKGRFFMQKADQALAPEAVRRLEAGIDRLINGVGLDQ